MRIGLIGAGLIGGKRAAHMQGGRLIVVCDQDTKRSQALAEIHQAEVESSYEALVKRADIDAVIVSTTNDALVPCSLAALQAGKHVLVEKPAARDATELGLLQLAAEKSGLTVSVGFNHRFHPAFQRAKKVLADPKVGPLMYVRARYGHGGRLGYDREWRADPTRSGGGELLDQGVHLIDLCRWLGGEFALQWGLAKTFFWNMPVEDNGFVLLRSPDGARSAFLHASCTEWKNLFDFEIFCKQAKLEIWGLGRSYGQEELRVYQMKSEMGPPDLSVERFAEEDRSWQNEFDAFVKTVHGAPSDIATLADAARALEIVQGVYRQSNLHLPSSCSV